MALPEIKQNIMATLAGNPTVYTIGNFNRDYRELMGTEIPYKRFKFYSLEQFLRSLTDVCEIRGSGPMAQIYPIVTEKGKYLNEFVMFQKNSRPKGRYQRPLPKRKLELPPRFTRCTTKSSVIEGPPVYYQNFTNNNSNNNASFSSTTNQSVEVTTGEKDSSELPCLMDVKLDFPMCSQDSSELTRFYLAGDSIQESAVYNNRIISDRSKPSHHHHHHGKNVEKTPNVMMNQISSDLLVNNNNNNNNSGYNSIGSSDHSEEASALPQSLQDALNLVINDVEEDCTDVPKKVQDNLKTLIKEFDDGIWCCDLPDYYKKRFKSTLHYSEYGYSCLIEMCMDLKNIFHYHRPGEDDFLLYNRDKPMPETCNKKYTISSFDVKPKKEKLLALPPDLEFSDFKGIIPNDIVKYGDELSSEFSGKDFKVNDTFDVVVQEVYDPSKFWIYLGTHYASKFDDIMDEMQEFYGNTDNCNKYLIPPGACKRGLYCVALYLTEYHRAKILKVFKDKTVRILYIDCGTIRRVPIDGLCFLTLEFSKLPTQAIRCRLANIEPVLKEHPWSVSAVKHFRDLVNGKATQIRLSAFNQQNEFIWVFLADITDLNNVFYINDALVEGGFAIWTDQTKEEPKDRLVLSNYACLVKNLYLYPTFNEIEDGLVPCSGDMQFLSEKHVPLELCMPQCFKLKDEIVAKNYHDMTDIQNAFSHGIRAAKLNPSDDKSEKTEIDYDMFGSLKNEIQIVHQKILKNAQKSSFACDAKDDASAKFDDEMNVNNKELVPYNLLSNAYSSDTSTDLKNNINNTQLSDCIKTLLTSNIFDNPEDFGNGSSSSDDLSGDDVTITPVAPSQALFTAVKEHTSPKKTSSISWADNKSSKESKEEFIKSLLSTNPFKSMLMKEVEEENPHQNDVSPIKIEEIEECKAAETDFEQQSSAQLSYPPPCVNNNIPQLNQPQSPVNVSTSTTDQWNMNAPIWSSLMYTNYPYYNHYNMHHSPSAGNIMYPNHIHQHNYYYQYQFINGQPLVQQQHNIPSVPPGFQARDSQMYQNQPMIRSLRPNERIQQIKNNFRETQKE